jgi:hypothetical protein
MADCDHNWDSVEDQVGTTDSGEPIIEVTIICSNCGASG